MKKKRSSIARFLRVDRGGAMLELAIAIPILLLLAVGVADYARVYYTGITVANASKAGATKGAWTLGNPDSMAFYAQMDAGTVTLDTISAGRYCKCQDGSSVNCTTGDCGAYGVPRAYDSVRVVKMVPLVFNYLGLPTSFRVARTTIMRPQ